ncbi:MAG: thioredoxin family protein [Pseudobdellovibrio sp.]
MKALRVVSIFFLGLFFCLAARARLTDDQVVFKVTDNKIEITTNAGFHLNAEAPASLTADSSETSFGPTTKAEKLFLFQVPSQTKKVKINFYVCDDKKTACEKHQKEIELSKTKEKTKSSADPVNKKENKKSDLVIIDKLKLYIFSAPWCPACIRMQTEVYPQKKIQALFKNLDIKKINIDLPENLELSEKFHVKAIPTLILINQKDQEVARWLDYQPDTLFAKQLGENLKNTIAIAELEKKARLGDAISISMMGMNAYNTLNFEDAIKWFSLSKKDTDLNYKLAAEVSSAEEQDQTQEINQIEHIRALEKAITMSYSAMDKYRWTTDWIEKLKDKKPLSNEATLKAKAAIENFSELLKNEKKLTEAIAESTLGDVGAFGKEEVLLMISRLYAAQGLAKERKESLNQVIMLIGKKKLTTEKPGEILLAIAYLKEAEAKETVEKLYQQLLQKYPVSYVYHEKHSRYLLKEKNLTTALAEVDSALLYPEGNEPQLYLLKARILNEMDNKKTALGVLDLAMGYEKISHQRYKKTVSQIEKLKKELASNLK